MKTDRFKRLIGYGVGDFGLNIYWHSLPLILWFWYTEIVGLDPKVAGWIYALGLLWDAISDPLVASLAAANHSRYGVYRPFLLFGSFGLGASFCLLFWAPQLEGWPLFVALLLSAILFRTCYTIVAVPYSALTTRLTFSSNERAELSGVRMFFAFCGMLCVTSFFFPISRLTDGRGDYSSEGFLFAAILGALVGTLALIVCFIMTEEKPPLGGEDRSAETSPRSFYKALSSNRAFQQLLLILFLNSAAGACLSIPMVFFIEANSQILAAKEVVLTAFALATIVGTPIFTLLTKSIGKKKSWYLASILVLISGLSLFLFGTILIVGVPVQILCFGFANAAFAIIIWTLIPDTVEFGQYQSGVRAEGPIFGASLFVQKASAALSGIAVGYLLSGVGYDAQKEIQTAETAAGIEAFMALAPAGFLVLASLVIYKMPLTRNLHGRIIKELSR